MTTAPRKKNPEIPDSLLRELKENVALRNVSKGIALLDAHAHLLSSLDPEQPNAAAFAGYVAQWVDIGFRGPELLQDFLPALTPFGDRARFRKKVEVEAARGDADRASSTPSAAVAAPSTSMPSASKTRRKE